MNRKLAKLLRETQASYDLVMSGDYPIWLRAVMQGRLDDVKAQIRACAS